MAVAIVSIIGREHLDRCLASVQAEAPFLRELVVDSDPPMASIRCPPGERGLPAPLAPLWSTRIGGAMVSTLPRRLD